MEKIKSGPIIEVSSNVTIEQKYNMFELQLLKLEELDPLEAEALLFGYNPTFIRIKDKYYETIPLHRLVRMKSEDGYYRFLYIQINLATHEFYIGKVNRKRWKEIVRYQGSGLLFTKKYEKHKDEFIRYYIASCNTQQETEKLEADIVDEVLLADEKCLNLVSGGGGTNVHPTSEETKKKHSENMKAHPERYHAMMEATKEMFCSGDTIQLEERNKHIKETMNTDEYRRMTSERIKNWKANHPEEYEKARENNRRAVRSAESRAKRSASRKKWIEDHPEEFAKNEEKSLRARTSKEANEKRKKSIRAFRENNPEKVKENQARLNAASVKATSKKVDMLDLETGEIIKSFDSQHEAARWLVEQGIAKSMNCVSSINAVCLKRPCSSGYGYRKKAYGFGWQFSNKGDK